MDKNQGNVALRSSVVAVQTALLSMLVMPAAFAADTDLTRPTNSIEVGVASSDKNSYKFGEYNGLEKGGAHVNLGFKVNGGDADSTSRFSLTGTNLGLGIRNITGEFADQGTFRIKFGYDEILRNQSDSYQTPYKGAGTGTLTLDSGVWQRVAGGLPYVTGIGNALTVRPDATLMTNGQMGSFQDVDTSTKRATFTGGLSLQINPRWSVEATARHQEKTGIRQQGMAILSTGGQVTLPMPVDYTTNDFGVSAAYVGDKFSAKAAYTGSLFTDNIKSLTFDNPYTFAGLVMAGGTNAGVNPIPGNTGRFSTMPDNQYHQFSLSGDYKFSPTTKLVGDLAYGRGTQNDEFLPYSVWGNRPAQSSFSGRVNTTAANLKLTMKPIKALAVTAAYKYDQRENNSQSSLYTFATVDNGRAANQNIYNTPFSRKLQQLSLEGDYAFGKAAHVKAGWDRQDISRYCNNIPAAALVGVAGDCVNVDKSKEDTYRLEYRNSFTDTVNGRIGYEQGNRGGDYSWDKINNEAAGSRTLPQIRYDTGRRDRERLRGSVNWQVSDRVGLTGGVDYKKDNFPSSPFGLQSSDSTVYNLDGSFDVAEGFTINAYGTSEDLSNKLREGSTAANTWNATQTDKINTLGLTMQRKGLMAGRLELMLDASVSRAHSPIDVSAAQANTGTGAWGNPPELVSNLSRIKLSAKYTMDKASTMRFDWLHQRLESSNYAWNGLQFNTDTGYAAASAASGAAGAAGVAGFYSALLPTNESAPNYRVNAVSMTYQYSFQ